MNKYKFYANLILTFHLSAVLLELASLPLVLLFPNLRFLVVIFVVVTVLQWIVLKDKCLFTMLENNYRAKYPNSGAYKEGCIQHYLKVWFGLNVSNFAIDLFLYGYFALIIYAAIRIK